MATLTYLEESYEVDHATKGADFIHGFDKNGCPVVFFDGITDFSGFGYTGVYMDPSHCAADGCNDLLFVGGRMQTKDGRSVARTVEATLASASWTGDEAPYSYKLSINGITATSNQEVLPAIGITTEQLEALQGANLVDGGQANGYTTLLAFGDKPEINIPIRVVLRGDA